MSIKVIDTTAQTDPNCYGPHMKPNEPTGIILHHDGAGPGGEAGTINWLSHWHPNPVSTNKYITRDGTIHQIVPDNQTAWHAGISILNGRGGYNPDTQGTCNDWCIGIEIANSGTGQEPYTDAQYESVGETVAYEAALHHINDRNISSHARVALPPGRKDDPLGWDWLRMWAVVDRTLANWPAGWPPKWNGVGYRITSTI